MPPENDRLSSRFRADLPFDPAGGAVAGLSGGPDSTALLHLLLEVGVPAGRLIAAHLDHGMRADSRRDSDFVEHQARSAGVRFVVERADVKAAAAAEGRGLEETARDLRYAFLARVAATADTPRVATGHHLDDQAETVLMRVLRGTGLRGLRAMRPERPMPGHPEVALVRPLLRFTREEIVAWLATRGLPYRIDPTNLDGSNRRSVVRTRLLPRLGRTTPGLAARLAALADLAAKYERDRPRSLYHELLEALPSDAPMLDHAAVERASEILARGAGRSDLAGEWVAVVEDGRIEVRRRDGETPKPSPFDVSLPCPGIAALPDGRAIEAVESDDEKPATDPERETFDLRAAPPPYRVRFAGEGDRFRPLGLDAETTVFRFLMGQGVPRKERGAVPVVWSGECPVWVVGYRLDDRAKVTERTTRRATLAVSPSSLPRRPARRLP